MDEATAAIAASLRWPRTLRDGGGAGARVTRGRFGPGRVAVVAKWAFVPWAARGASAAAGTTDYCSTGMGAEVDDGVAAELAAEAAVLTALPPHAHVVRLLAAAPGVVVIELCEGGPLAPLAWRCLGDGAMDMLVPVSAWQAACALAHLHAQSPPIVHGDVALRNLLLARPVRGTGPRALARVHVKLADFGLAGPLDRDGKDGGAPAQTRPTLRLAVRWAAPEALATEHVSPATDVWALGVAVWEMCHGGQRAPYDDVAKDAAAVRHWVGTERRTLSRPPACPPAVWAVVEPCFAFDPAARPTAAVLASLLAVLVEDAHSARSH